MKPKPVHATLPHFGGASERRALLAGITFLDITGSDELSVPMLADWFEEHVVANGYMPRLSVLLEPPAGSVALRATGAALEHAAFDLPRLAATARARVLLALRGLIGSPSDDRFLRAAIFCNRVRREESRWIARPEPTAPVSGIVLSLFAMAILTERALYDHMLCVCDTCGTVSFDPTPAMRRLCSGHAQRNSGVQHKTPPRGAASG